MIEPDYFRATNKAYEVLNGYDSYSIPTTIFLLIRKFKNIKLYSYSEVAKRTGITYNEFYKTASSEFGFSVIDIKTNKCIIFYNDKKSEEVIRFTLAHELGHYVLGHLVDGDKENKEANCFARNVLCPIPVVMELELTTANEYVDVFYVSEPMAEIAVDFQQSDYYYITSYNYSTLNDKAMYHHHGISLNNLYGINY